MKSDAIFKKYFTAETAERRDYLNFSFSALCELCGELIVSSSI